MNKSMGTAFLVVWSACAIAVGGGPAVRVGIDVRCQQKFKLLDGQRVGLITNPTGVNGDLMSTVDLLHAARNVKLVSLYGPGTWCSRNIMGITATAYRNERRKPI